MKKLIRLLVLLLILCGLSAALADEPLAVWPKEHAPQKIIHAGDCWYAMMGTYGGSDAELAVGPSPDEMTSVYSADAHVWSFVATGSHAAWVQNLGNERLEWMLYDRASGEVTQVHSEAVTKQRPCFAVALTQEQLFFVRTVGEAGQLCVRSLTDGTEEAWGEDAYPIGALTVREGVLLMARKHDDGWRLIGMDAVQRSWYREIPLPDYVAMVYDVDIDPVSGFTVMYYMDKQGREHAAVLLQTDMMNLFTFARGTYAVDDMVEIANGHFRWGVQIEASGYVTDHYYVVDYDLMTNRPAEHPRSYWFSSGEEGLLVLSFGEDRAYETCVLNVYPAE